MTHARGIARLRFLDVGKKQEHAFARVFLERRFGALASEIKIVRIECRMGHSEMGLDMIALEAVEPSRALETLASRISGTRVNVGIGNVGMGFTLPRVLQHLRRLTRIIEPRVRLSLG